MIRITELRIGNCVYNYSAPKPVKLPQTILYKVSEIGFGNVELTMGDVFDYKNDFRPFKENIRNLIGINLTEDWLIKLEFDQLVNGTYIHSGFNSQIVLKKEIDGYSFELYIGTKTVIKYIHQIQNLVFAITGEELKIL